MKIRVEMENKEIRSCAELTGTMGLAETSEVYEQNVKNMSIKAKNFSMSNTRNDNEDKVVTEMEINCDFLIKIIRKMHPVIIACKTVWGLIKNMFEDMVEDIGDEDDWDIYIEGESNEEATQAEGMAKSE